MEPSFGYTGAKVEGHHLWPYKLVTRIFEDAQATAHERGDIEVILHTKTPVTGFERIQDTNHQHHRQRRWKLQTPRGSILCNYVVHATNGYAAHLLPFLNPQGLIEEDKGDVDVHRRTSDNESEAAASPHISHHIFPKPKPRDVYGIIPTRGQVGAVRASVRAEDLGWKNSWVGGGERLEYWFPRYQGLAEGPTNFGNDVHEIKTGTGTRNNGTETMTRPTAISRNNPLIILGGGRQNAGENMESGETDDGLLNERVGKALREFLPRWFPGKFESDEVNWEMEWVGNNFVFPHFFILITTPLDWDNGVYEDGGSFCMYFLLPFFIFH